MGKKHPTALPGYETTIITKTELTDEALKTLSDKIEKIISDFQGDVVYTEDWGRKKLAYPIQKESRGRYTYLAYTGKGGVVQEIERNLRIAEPVLRFATVKLSDSFDADWYHKNCWYYAKRQPERDDRRDEKKPRYSM